MSQESQPLERRSYAFVNRESRRVPLNWEHPRNEKGQFIGLSDHSRLTEESISEWLSEEPGLNRDKIESWHMPDFSNIPEEQMGICAYETTSEGTPISPVFPDSLEGRFELAQYCMENATVFGSQKCPDIEGWRAILFDKDLALLNMAEGTIEITKPRQEQ